jgi:hypothetical protein
MVILIFENQFPQTNSVIDYFDGNDTHKKQDLIPELGP